MDSILNTIKQMLGIDIHETVFDVDIIVHINSVLATLNQLGIGESTGFSIADDTAIWSEFLGVATNLEEVKSYIVLRVRLLFDPPSSSFVIEALNRQIKEMEWRLNVQVEGG